jgi:hypothetical protein
MRVGESKISRIVVTLLAVIAGIVVVNVQSVRPASANSCGWTSQMDMEDALPPVCRAGYVFDPGYGQLMTRQELLSNPAGLALFNALGFTENFIWYAPQTKITFSPTQNNTLQWNSCVVSGSDFPDPGTMPTPCPSASDVVHDPSHTIESWDLNDNPVPQDLDTWTWQGSSIFLVCGNPIYPLPPPPQPLWPTIVGSKFNDINRNGVWDTGEPGIPNWPMTLTRVTSTFNDQPTGVVVATTATDSNGNFNFALHGDGGPGEYAVTEGSEPNWYNDTGGTTEYVTIDTGIGTATLSVPPFGNWHNEVGSQVHAVVQVETSPSYAGDAVMISSAGLTNSCAPPVLFETLQGGSTLVPRRGVNSLTAVLDDDGNATVVVDAADCASGSDLIEADLTQAPFLTATTTLDVEPPQVTPVGVSAYPSDEVETGNSPASGESDVYTVFYVETNPVYAGQPVEISSPELQNRCSMGWRWEPAGGPGITQASPPSPVEATLDGDGNAVVVFKGASCAAGDSSVIADVLAGSHPTYTTTFTIDPPAVTLAGTMKIAGNAAKGAPKVCAKHPSRKKCRNNSGGGTGGAPQPMTVTASPNPLVETSGKPVVTP